MQAFIYAIIEVALLPLTFCIAIVMSSSEQQLTDFLRLNPTVERIEVLLPDMNGIFRGKSLPVSAAKKLMGGLRFPLSFYMGDIWGHDVDAAGLALEVGDPDAAAQPVMSSLCLVPWAKHPTAQVVMSLFNDDGSPVVYDPRAQLKFAIDRLVGLGLTAVVAAELEFYLIDGRNTPQDPPKAPTSPCVANLYDVQLMAEHEDLIRDIRIACEQQSVPMDLIIAEYGRGQYEINLNHVDDPLLAADHAVLLKRIVRGCARNHGLDATFMAKPYGDEVGSGLHVHASLLNKEGNNVFSSDEGVGKKLEQANAGLLDTMLDCQAIFTPHLNSYRRILNDHFPARSISWGLDNRAVSVRVPATKGIAARLEHRICGADVNPYLAIAAILGGIANGLEQEMTPPAIQKIGDPMPKTKLSSDWMGTIERFGQSEKVKALFGPEYQKAYAAVRMSEASAFNDRVSNVEHEVYLNQL